MGIKAPIEGTVWTGKKLPSSSEIVALMQQKGIEQSRWAASTILSFNTDLQDRIGVIKSNLRLLRKERKASGVGDEISFEDLLDRINLHATSYQDFTDGLSFRQRTKKH